jgi:DNA-binding beta-propeller fold protein YncE
LSFTVQSGAVAVTVDQKSANAFVAAASGAIWTLAEGQPAPRPPMAVSGQPVGLAVDVTSGHLLVAQRAPAAVIVLDIPTGQTIASVPLPSDPGDLRFDADLQRAFVVLPDQGSLATLDTRDPHVLQVTADVSQVTGMALDAGTHRLFLSHLDGQLSTLDVTTGQLLARERLSGPGLSGVSTVNGQVYAINTPGRELLIYDPAAPSLKHVPLDAEPAAVVTGSTVSVLEPATGTVVELDLMGTVNHVRAQLSGEPLASVPLSPEALWQRPRMAMSPNDGAVYVVDPGSGALAVSPADT